MELNTVHHCNFLDNDLPDKCAKLIIADPPYYEVKGEFDFIWPTFAKYLQDVRRWADECLRLLADNGTLFWYGPAKKIAYSQIILDRRFSLVNNLVWHKGRFLGLEYSDEMRSFAPCTERILMYTNETGDLSPYMGHIRDYIREEIQAAKGKIVLKDVNAALGTATNGGGVASACLSLDKAEPAMITGEMYDKLREWLGPQFLSRPYEQLRQEYEDLRNANRRFFHNGFRLQEVLNFSNESSTTGAAYDHETVKPETLTRALILSCSRPEDLVLVPFAGSGTECAMAIKENRKAVGFEINEKHVRTASRRLSGHIQQPQFSF